MVIVCTSFAALSGLICGHDVGGTSFRVALEACFVARWRLVVDRHRLPSAMPSKGMDSFRQVSSALPQTAQYVRVPTCGTQRSGDSGRGV